MEVNLFKAVVARCTEKQIWFESGDEPNPYIRKQNWLQHRLLFTYFFPAIYHQGKYQVYIPGPCDRRLIEYMFLDCYGGTSLNHAASTALDGSLHYVEYIRPFARSLSKHVPSQESIDSYGNPGIPTLLYGYCFFKVQDSANGCSKGSSDVGNLLRQVLKNIQVGGERSSGWGKLTLAGDGFKELGEIPSDTSPAMDLFTVVNLGGPLARLYMKSGSPCIKVGGQEKKKEGYIPAHLKAEPGLVTIRGRNEMLYTRETITVKGRTQFGGRTRAIPCLAPGAAVQVEGDKHGGSCFRIEPVSCIWKHDSINS